MGGGGRVGIRGAGTGFGVRLDSRLDSESAAHKVSRMKNAATQIAESAATVEKNIVVSSFLFMDIILYSCAVRKRRIEVRFPGEMRVMPL